MRFDFKFVVKQLRATSPAAQRHTLFFSEEQQKRDTPSLSFNQSKMLEKATLVTPAPRVRR